MNTNRLPLPSETAPRVVPLNLSTKGMNTTIPNHEGVEAAPLPEKPTNGAGVGPTNRVPRGPVPLTKPERRAVAEPSVDAPKPERPSVWRRLVFRTVRLALTVAVLVGAGTYVRHVVTSAISDQAYINAEITVLRAPIEGQLRLEAFQPGAMISQGTSVFRVENPRFGNQEVNGQLNWVRELTERLQAEADEAAVRCQQQEQVYRLHEKLHRDKLIPDLEFFEEQTKVAASRSVLTNKLIQARQAAARAREVEAQVELQKQAVVNMPCDGVVWMAPAKPGVQVAAHEPVLQVIDPRRIWVDAFFHERKADKLRPGVAVVMRAVDGVQTWHGRVESVRAGVGRIAYDNFPAGLPGEYVGRRVAVRVTMESKNPFDASQFFGVGRSVVVSLADHE
jgi:multidrug resistance efflux pump